MCKSVGSVLTAINVIFVAHSLPTDIQAESIPLILGGGDVLMAFSIPVIQIVYETLKDQQEGKKGKTSVKTGSTAIGSDGLCCQSREIKEWHGCRSTRGVNKGKYFHEKFDFC
uniref:Uncharacterized protein n=1 Tax=Xenopus tropicalis TaxID=8364 RepID=A0A1B8XSV7_XENTR